MNAAPAMKKRASWLIFLLFSLALTFVAFAEEQQLRVIGSEANVRLEPSTQSKVIKLMPLGAVLKTTKKEGTWYLVELPGENGLKILGYIHQSTVQIVDIPKVENTIKEPTRNENIPTNETKGEEPNPSNNQNPPVRTERTEPRRSVVRNRKDPSQKTFKPKFGLGFSFSPGGDYSELFNLGIGASLAGGLSISSTPPIDLIGGIDAFTFLRKGSYTDVNFTRLILYGDIRIGQPVGNIKLFAEAGLGLYFDMLDIETYWWYATDSEFNMGARFGGGMSFGNFEILAMYHAVSGNMFTIMFSFVF
jgi:hypothetical protein